MDRLHDNAMLHPDKVAAVFTGGVSLTYGELDRRASRVARWLISLGLAPGDGIALLMDNDPRTFELWFGARRAGIYYTPLSTQLTRFEVADIVNNCGAKLLITTARTTAIAEDLAPLLQSELIGHFVIGESQSKAQCYEAAVLTASDEGELPPRPVGREFLYSSGTTGKPRGIRRPLARYEDRYALPELEKRLRTIFEIGADTVYLSPSPLYHSTGRFNVRVIECGGTAVVMDKFDSEAALAAIERHRVTHSHWVPTMFVKLLALPEATRARYDLASMRRAIHAAAPCPPELKDAMIQWWGPILDEYYGGTENAGVTYIDSHDWLLHRGSVGRPICGAAHIVGDDGAELVAGTTGSIWFSGGVGFAYHNDAAKTASAVDARGWATYGDLGHLDAEGYLYISDRRADLVVTGGVNVYPQEIENVLLTHPAVFDAAVIGVPDAVYGEQVKAVVQLKPASACGDAVRADLLAHCASRLSKIKCPRTIDFVDALPRTETGKLLRRVLKARYRTAHN